MNSKLYRLMSGLALILGLIVSNAVLAEDHIEIDSASPNYADQGMLGRPITIKGKGFDKTVKEVKFLLPCTPEPSCTGADGGITVTNFTVDDPNTVTATIDVSDTAVIGSYYIAMRTRGRGGKGTTYKSSNDVFEVKLRPNQELVSCDVFAPGGTCNCRFVVNDGDKIYGMQESCQTSETLMISGHIRTAGSVQTNGPERLTLTAVNCNPALHGKTTSTGATYECAEEGFKGSSVVANTTNGASVRYLIFEFDDDVSRGCEPAIDDIRSAISFVLDDYLPDGVTPFPDPRDHEGGPTTLLQVWNTTIDGGLIPLCNAIEIIRTQDYTNLFVDPTDELPAVDWKVNVEDSWIKSGSYVKTGILYQGILKWGENIGNPPLISGNTIEAPACENPDAAIAILLGPTFHLDPDLQVESLVQGNTITMENTCNGPAESFGTAVLMLGEKYGYQTTAAINNNDISGAFIGVLIDSTINKANFKGNTLTGDNDPPSGDIGICSNVLIDTKGKPNNIRDYSYPIIEGVCPPPPPE